MACVLAGLMGAGFGTACKHSESSQKEDQAMVSGAPADSPFAKIKKDMSQDEVVGILGQATEMQTGPGRGNWIPFNFGGASTILTVLHYKGQGRIHLENKSRYGGTMVVVKVEYNPNELISAK